MFKINTLYALTYALVIFSFVPTITMKKAETIKWERNQKYKNKAKEASRSAQDRSPKKKQYTKKVRTGKNTRNDQ